MVGLFNLPSSKQKPRVYNKHHGNAPADAFDITRSGPLGNPFEIGKHGTRAEVIAKYKEWLPKQKKLMKFICEELPGRDVVCVCAPRPCHGDFILEIANHKKSKR